jgi:hypothetical protein
MQLFYFQLIARIIAESLSILPFAGAAGCKLMICTALRARVT